jgi:hypothetical protein
LGAAFDRLTALSSLQYDKDTNMSHFKVVAASSLAVAFAAGGALRDRRDGHRREQHEDLLQRRQRQHGEGSGPVKLEGKRPRVLLDAARATGGGVEGNETAKLLMAQ